MKFHISIALLIVAAGRAATIPAGTELQIRLTSEASSDKPSGQAVTGVVIAPVLVAGAQAIAAGTRVSGKTADARAAVAATDQTQEQPASLRIQFTKILDEAGHSQPLDAVLESIDNARESVNASGLITGITASETFEARMDQGINKLETRNQALAQILSGVKGAFVKKVDPSIDYQPGVEMTIKLNKALDWNVPVPATIAEISPLDVLTSLVNSEPFRTIAQKPPSPSDMTNLMFIGTSEQVQDAFKESGWFAGSALSPNAKFETAKAIVENRGYSEAPMSILYLDGKPPDLTFQKQNDTFEKRHHIRIWMRPQTFNGKPVFVAAATHDISITFSQTSRNFTHGIDPGIDKERSKVANDLLFTGRVHAFALVERTNIPKDASNATGDKLITDGKMAVLEF